MREHDLKVSVKRLMATQLYGVLATQSDSGAPHTSIVAFVSADDLNSIVFVTPRNTRKCKYIIARPEVAFFVDDRRERVEELMQVVGVEARGRGMLLDADEYPLYRELYLAKYPEMTEFVDAAGSAMVRIAVSHYDVVDHFQHVVLLQTDSSPELSDDPQSPPAPRSSGALCED